MSLSPQIQQAVAQTFPSAVHDEVFQGLLEIPESDDNPWQQRPSAEFLQGAVLVLSHGDLAAFHSLLMNAQVEPRDIIYELQSPDVRVPGMTTDILVARYHQLQLPLPACLQIAE